MRDTFGNRCWHGLSLCRQFRTAVNVAGNGRLTGRDRNVYGNANGSVSGAPRDFAQVRRYGTGPYRGIGAIPRLTWALLVDVALTSKNKLKGCEATHER